VGRACHDRDLISITTKSRYALAALVELYAYGDRGPVPIAELARRRDIPVQFLEQLFATLRRAGLLRSQRGVKGGYSFARPAGDITVLELVELLDGSVGRDATGVFAQAGEAARAVLANWTVAEVAEAEARTASAPMYHI
jgi:Rrf2 family transcriptional regulator, cysteine metabolism repressor